MKNYEQQGLAQSQELQKSNIVERLIDFFNPLKWLKYKRHQQKHCDTPLQTIRLQVNTELIALDQVLKWYEQLEHLSIPQKVWLQCQLALAEGFTNVVRHAHKGLPLETPIEIAIMVFNERLEMRIWDYGQPFDLEAKLRELRELKENRLCQEGGRGLSIIQNLVTRVNYTRTSNKRNCLLLVKYFDL
ncbi:MAG: ATP-binding protein [Xenococcaceae cyanobacterium]